MGKKFSIADYANLVTVSEMDRPEIVMIPWDKIAPNAGNFYAVEDVTDLLNAIEMQGLLSPIVVTPDRESDGYRLISGHRRHKAWGQLRAKDPEKYAAIPAIVRSFGSEAEERLALILSNSAARVLTPYEIGQQAQEVEMVFYQLKEQGFEFPGRMREHVAKAVKQSSSKLARIRAIETHLAECWREAWKKGTINEAVAYELQKAPTRYQELFWECCRNSKPRTRAADITAYTAGEMVRRASALASLQCTMDGGQLCIWQEPMFREVHKRPGYATCYGQCEKGRGGCCATCSEIWRCDSVCPKLREKAEIAKAEHQQRDEKQRKEAEARCEESRRQHFEEAAARQAKETEEWKRIGALRRAAGLSVAEAYGFKPDELDADDVADIEGREAGMITGESIWDDLFFDSETVLHAAERMGCSTDAIFGREPRAAEAVSKMDTVPEWQAGEPERSGRYLCKVDLGDDKGPLEYTCEYLSGQWLAFGSSLFKGAKVTAWWPLPDE